MKATETRPKGSGFGGVGVTLEQVLAVGGRAQQRRARRDAARLAAKDRIGREIVAKRSKVASK